MNNEPLRIWDGIEDAFPPAPKTPLAFDSSRWLDAQRKAVESEIALVNTPGPSTLLSTLPLPVLLAPLVKSGKSLSVLDFGGGAGVLYPSLRDCLPCAHLDMHVVETDAVCNLGRALFDSEELSFHTEIPQRQFDVIHAANSLHYVADWRSLLERFALMKPRLIVLTGLTAGNIPSFVTYQEYYGTRIPVWFFSRKAVESAMESLGYKLVYHSLLDFPYLGERGALPMDHFPASHRLQRKCNLVFAPEVEM